MGCLISSFAARWMVGGGKEGVGTKAGCWWEAERAGWGLWSLLEVVGMINGSFPCPVPGQTPRAAALSASRALRKALWPWLRLILQDWGPTVFATPVWRLAFSVDLLACMMGVVGTLLGADPHEL